MQTLLRNVLLGGGGGYSPASLFVGGVEGALYDPSDLSTLYQDSAGTTPVTGVEQVVGLMLDKSQGLVLGANVLGSVWSTLGSAVASGSSVTFNSVSDIAAFQSVMTAGVRYLVSFDYNITSGQAGLYVGTNGGTGAAIIDLSGLSGTGSFSGYFIAGTATFIFRDNTGCVASFTNITLRAQLGNHATSTGSARPTLSARVNLLTYSEEFDNGVWSKSGLNAFGSGSVANTTATLDPLGGNTADFIQENTALAGHSVSQTASNVGVNYIFTCYAKGGGRAFVRLKYFDSANNRYGAVFDLSTGVATNDPNTGSGVIVSSSALSAGNGWWRLTITGNAPTIAGATFAISMATSATTTNQPSVSYTGDGTSGIYIWGADLRPANIGVNIPSYQRIAAATNYDTNGFPFYLSFGGAQSMSTPANLDLTSTDKVTVYAGVRKLSDAFSIVAELSSSVSANNGTFGLWPPGFSGNWAFASKGTTLREPTISLPAPNTSVLTGIGDISGDIATLRANGVAATNTGDQGTGNYGTYPLFIGARNNASSFFTGYLYSLIIQGAAASATQLASTEAWVNQKTKAY